MAHQPTLNIIGAGHVGRALGRVFAASGCFAVQDVLTRQLASAQQAVDFIGAGRAVKGMAEPVGEWPLTRDVIIADTIEVTV